MRGLGLRGAAEAADVGVCRSGYLELFFHGVS